ncbi:hypothetical protein ASG43_08885 [Aureimonas sp. Leaf454]|uniref:hypothetical protein n=1 Tax=Aureimonas sp. Leaf454 TaxID=1736381 RepID=UPI0006F8396E|nr:hypothetical protein [Aureimonas sp. Leaf454]KQT48938.1 hypothetical protein ASG43_08885 [Aureimonas sp. Leaf454]
MSDFETAEVEGREEQLERMRAMSFEEVVADPAAHAVSDTPSDTAPVTPAPKVEAAPAEVPVPPFAPSAATYDRVPAVTVPLLHPFTAGGVRVRTIRLTPPRLDYIEARAAGRITRLEMVAEMASLPKDVIGAMRWPDAERILSFAADIAPDVAA